MGQREETVPGAREAAVGARVVVGVDGTRASVHAVRYAAAVLLAPRLGARDLGLGAHDGCRAGGGQAPQGLRAPARAEAFALTRERGARLSPSA